MICFVSVRKLEIFPFPFVPSFDETLPILLERSADCFIVANIILAKYLFVCIAFGMLVDGKTAHFAISISFEEFVFCITRARGVFE